MDREIGYAPRQVLSNVRSKKQDHDHNHSPTTHGKTAVTPFGHLCEAHVVYTHPRTDNPLRMGRERSYRSLKEQNKRCDTKREDEGAKKKRNKRMEETFCLLFTLLLSSHH